MTRRKSPAQADREHAEFRACVIHALRQEGHPIPTGALRYLITKHNPGVVPGQPRVNKMRRELADAGVTREYVDTNQRFAPTMIALRDMTWVVPAPVLDGVADTVAIALSGIPNDDLQDAIRSALADVVTAHGGTIVGDAKPSRPAPPAGQLSQPRNHHPGTPRRESRTP